MNWIELLLICVVIDQEWNQNGCLLAKFFFAFVFVSFTKNAKKNEANIRPSWPNKPGQPRIYYTRRELDPKCVPQVFLGLLLEMRQSAIRDFKIQRPGWQRECRKNNRFNKQNNKLARASNFLYFSFPFLHDYGMKMPSVASQGGRKQGTTKFYFSFWAWIWSLEIQLQEGSPTFNKVRG